jgi:hypothetical protein
MTYPAAGSSPDCRFSTLSLVVLIRLNGVSQHFKASLQRVIDASSRHKIVFAQYVFRCFQFGIGAYLHGLGPPAMAYGCH